MRLCIFKSDPKIGLRAFAADPAGSRLPDQDWPWHAIGVVAADKSPPHGLSRLDIERVIETYGYQLWQP